MNTANESIKAIRGYVQKCTECGWLVGPVGETLCQYCWLEARRKAKAEADSQKPRKRARGIK